MYASDGKPSEGRVRTVHCDTQSSFVSSHRLGCHTNAWRKSVIIAFLVVMLGTATMMSMMPILSTRPQPGLNLLEHQSCGNSSNEARGRGCTFDIMSRFWVAPDCFYLGIDERFRQEHASAYYVDKEGQQQLPVDDVADFTEAIYTSVSYHRLHCKYLLLRNQLAVASGGKLPAAMTSFQHTEHCVNVLSQHNSSYADDLIQIFDMSFPPCVSPQAAFAIAGKNST
jgi:hypothetical protein